MRSLEERKALLAQVQNKRTNDFAALKSELCLGDRTVDEKRNQILNLTLLKLQEALQNEKFTSSKVLDAYTWKALQVQEKLNPICFFIKEAKQQAKELDEKFHGKQKPPLFGLPFSVKENYYIVQLKGYDSTVGNTRNLHKPKDQDNTFVVILRQLGAVPFVVTNIPQTLIGYLTSNPIYGTTGNPHDPNRVPGGSSGGEAALLVAGGSTFGIGSDIGGSLRIPSTFCGCVTIKPTEARIIIEHADGGIPGKGRMASTFGFLTKTVDDQIFLLKHLLCAEFFAMSPRTVPLPFCEKQLNNGEKLRIGYFIKNGFLDPVPGFARVINETVASLQKAGHRPIEFAVPEPMKMMELIMRNLFPDNGEMLAEQFDDEVVDKYMQSSADFFKVSDSDKMDLANKMQEICPQISVMLKAVNHSPGDVRKAQAMADQYREQFLHQWRQLELDVIICPGFTVPAIPHEYPAQLISCVVSTSMFNLLDLPAGIVPTGLVTKEDEADMLDEKKWPTNKNPQLEMMRQASTGAVGLPLAVQVVALPYREETCLRAMKMIETMFQ